MRNVIDAAARVCATICVGLLLVACGFAVCVTPAATGVFAQAFSGCENPETPFGKEELVLTAQSIRAYSFTSHSRQEMLATLHEVNDRAKTPYAHTSDEELLSAPDVYALDESALSHLDDVYAVALKAYLFIAFLVVLAAASLGHIAYHKGKPSIGGVLAAAALAVMVLFALCGAWVLLDFNGFFTFFHSLFFADGTWTFSYRSLMISSLPTPFWIGMGTLWVGVTLLASLACFLLGRRLERSVK